MRIEKGFNITLIFILTGVLLCPNAALAEKISSDKSYLRPPLIFSAGLTTDAELQELMAYLGGDDLPKLNKEHFEAYPTIAGYEQSMETIYKTMKEAEEGLRKAIEEKALTYHHSDLLVDLVITRLMLFETIFLANQENAAQETVEKSLDNALLASKFLRRNLNDYKIFVFTGINRDVKSSL